MSDVFLQKKTKLVEKYRGSMPGSESILDREAGVLSVLDGQVGPKVENYDGQNKGLIMTRIGTHDLSDVIHDLGKEFVPYLVDRFFLDLQKIHDAGYIHRDIKPGNIMVRMDYTGVCDYAGIVDFGMTLISNRKQNGKFDLGGTEPYSHKTQLRGNKDLRAHPGQDWYAAARTVAHIMVGGGASTFEAQLLKDGELIQTIKNNFLSIFGDRPELLELITFSLTPNASKEEALPRLLELGTAVINKLGEGPKYPPSGLKKEIAFQDNAKVRPKRHDVLLIVDGTGSMASEIDYVKRHIEEVVESVKGNIDLRMDLWSLGDYSRSDGEGSSVEMLGQRMTSTTFHRSLDYLDATRGQTNDEAEAYEMALQYAYLRNPEEWTPRSDTTRTIIVVGDSYAHGWLQKYSPWGIMVNKARGRLNRDTGIRGDPDPKFKKMYDDFVRRHDQYMTREAEDRERDAYNKAYEQVERRDAYAKKGKGEHVKIQGESVQNRPNLEKAINKCVEEKNAIIHTVGIGDNYVSAGFLKYTALIGRGTYTHLRGEGDLCIILKGIFTSVDPKIFRDLERNTLALDPTTQALDSITTFVIDSMS
jgi:serine/threonine protein kinase